jgi:hypothetical protein
MLFEQGVPLQVVNAALTVAVARRTFRGGEPLPGVRALHYFLPVIEEVQQSGGLHAPLCDASYLAYLERKLRPLAAARKPQRASASPAR